MIRHVVLLDIDLELVDRDERIGEILAALRRLPERIPEITAYAVGADLGLADNNATIAITGDFGDVAAYETYRDHPEHQKVIAELILPVLSSRSAAQFEVA